MNGIRITSLFLMGLGGVQILRYMLNGAGDSMYALMNGIVEVIARVAFDWDVGHLADNGPDMDGHGAFCLGAL